MTDQWDDHGTTVPGADRQYYDQISFWNYFELVYRRLNLRATGDEDVFWYDELLKEGARFERGLILNCGNGWVERHLLKIGLVRAIVGIDISTELLEQARSEAVLLGLPAEYVAIDINTVELPEGPFDFVLNHAAVHHIAYIDRVLRAVRERMSPGGLYVNWDYIGPHRNQYNARQWEAAWNVNQSLPAELQQHMHYPHVPTMILEDPTEAVHSELTMSVTRRYFDISRLRSLGGAVGYILLTHNLPFYTNSLDQVLPWVNHIMDADDEFLADAPNESLFAYFRATPKQSLPAPAQLALWTAEEAQREHDAALRGGYYYPPTMLSTMMQSSEELSPSPRSNATGWRKAAARALPRLVAGYQHLRHPHPDAAGPVARGVASNGKSRCVMGYKPGDPPPPSHT